MELSRISICSAVLFSFFLLSILLVPLVFGSSEENWVEVLNINRTGGASFNSGRFTIDYPEWRIRWEFDPGHWHFADLHFLNITVYEEEELGTFYITNIYGSGNQNNGIYNVPNNIGKFYMKINTGIVENFTIIVEQNIESIPEFPSMTILISGLFVITLISIIYRQKRKQENQR